ncbi:uncharacterized protein LOC133381507 isoform X2 [Rhineura floridana]|uniref:uncharacterized protein LOC133381507 isoform X2 n=1 Tax=Rhineura floridana TaxID=261503 RepID=UPI002AC863E8|nr:uncharacterized protein LOC133381507 isoform X2 [Rhineura floridana]XP_061476671.1 uncharacterized protein LOC133381507 isoform X2 [Rhineura floridana]XP_061476672.1 uncharacterized protein LOC133381507 isoform X2 [Rhineura floridana]XP_061476674.1 uncharacterized protein LOC133381507 isoform X2 [Rhineura floridana]XP_061476675.1 uncharacterized protein LOC133381507 isoform X2 [Rhineura floridana]XP_061476676.1 uncharacterized protein LOC133381507 isoform X2 [Rhineura floridana]XP_06147667
MDHKHSVQKSEYPTEVSQDCAQLEPGDLIEVFEAEDRQHWAVYVGGGDVIHLAVSKLNQEGNVLKDPLSKVVHTSKYKVNNKYDMEHKPRPVHEIIQDATAKLGNKVAFDLLNYNCEHFATELRYGKAMSDQVQKSEYPTEVSQDCAQLEPGDLIEVFEAEDREHWAVYVGGGEVIHVCVQNFSMSKLIQEGEILKHPLSKVVKGKGYKINNKYDMEHKPRPVQEIIRDATAQAKAGIAQRRSHPASQVAAKSRAGF